uniref:Reverse transcriptase domain-containing protein n=1 Tax=Mycena chlorophos TaxID=658473 RepID=A0ABQ0L4W1_MYCCL|nr:predicted protein [Mycena chlorophos]
MSCITFNLAIEVFAAAIRNSELQGYTTPGTGEKLIASLFADDASMFLKADDKLSVLTKVKEDWCVVAGAKFNLSKEVIIPIGTKEYREEVIATRKTTPSGDLIPQTTNLAKDGEANQICGAWYGNETTDATPWANPLSKIDGSLENGLKCNPTIEGRRHLIQMNIGGVSQYLTQVQRMPENIEKRLVKRIRQYAWADEEKSPVALDTLQAPINEGRRGILDIEARNRAIDIMWLKEYLNFGPERPTWAYFADEIFALKAPKETLEHVDRRVRINPLLQSWKTARGVNIKIGQDLRSIIDTAQDYGLQLGGITLSKEAMREMPIWYHREADPKIRRLNNGSISECLRENHAIRTVGQAEMLAKRARNPRHRNRQTDRRQTGEDDPSEGV